MRLVSILTHSTTLLWLQQAVILWFVLDFFLARDSSTANKLFKEHAIRTSVSNNLLQNLDTNFARISTKFSCNETLLNKPTFDKIILIVIDALGAEFIPSISRGTNSGRNDGADQRDHRMPFLEQAMASNRAMAFVAKAATPTVTMPRIKSLVSGTIPSFLDVVYNLASDVSDFHDDNILRLARSRGKSLVFYGDDTWLALFDRSFFKRSRETLSLYASDYTSVDTNVTENAMPETKRNPLDWDYLILHYLGLDHIGHVFGSNEAPLIGKKLIEMDDVIREIYNDMAARSDKTLIVVCGDHGMSPEGNHGGDTPLESETAMVFLPINQELDLSRGPLQHDSERRILQIDMAATLSVLNGLPIPGMSRGVVIDQLLHGLWRDGSNRLTCAVISNLEQLISLLDSTELDAPQGPASRLLRLLERMATNGTADNTSSFVEQSLRLARDIQAQLIRTVAARSSPLLVLVALALMIFLSLINFRKSCIRLLMPLMTASERFVCLAAVSLPILMQGSTDYIELENAFWPLFSLTIFALFCFGATKTQTIKEIKEDLEVHRAILFAITFAITALWNNLSFLGPQDLGWALPMVSVIIMSNFSRQTSMISGKQSVLFFGTGLLVFLAKMTEEASERDDNHYLQVANTQILASIALLGITIFNLCTSFVKQDSEATSIVQKLATSWMWWVFLLSRSRNYVFLISNVVMEASLNSLLNTLRLSPIARAILYLLLSSHAFYGQGNSNLFSSLDIKPAFFGQTKYSFALAVPLIACATFGAQIYWYLKLFQRVQGEKEQERMVPRYTAGSMLIPAGTKDAIKDFVDMRNFVTIGYYMFVCAVLRNHLFIWSVVSPKLVYLFMTTLSLRVTTTMISNAPYLLNKLIHSSNRALPNRYKLLTD